MTLDSLICRLAQWIRATLQSNVVLSRDQRRFMLSTFGTLDFTDIFAGEGSEIDSFLELVFYPDPSMRLHFEAQWGTVRFGPDDISALVAQLCRQPVPVRIMADPQSSVRCMELPVFVLETVVQRLKIQWQPPQAIESGLRGIQSAAQRTAIRAELRHCPLPWHSAQAALIARFLEKMAGDDNLFPWLLELIDLLAEWSPGRSANEFFQARKAAFVHNAGKAEDFERRRQTQAMEVLMMQGDRAVHGSAAHWHARAAMVDRLSRALFGTIPAVVFPEEQRIDLAQHEPE